MGNCLCCENKKLLQENQEKLLFIKKMLKLNQKFLNRHLTQFTHISSYPLFQSFHQTKIDDIIKQYTFPYQETLCVNNEQDKLKQILNDLHKKKLNLFNQIITFYSNFLKEVFTLEDEEPNETIDKSNSTLSMNISYQFNTEKNLLIDEFRKQNQTGESPKKKNHQFLMITSKLYSISCLPSLLLRQLEYISQMLKEFIYYSYQFELKQEEDPIQQELLVQSIIQTYLFSNQCPFKRIFNPLLQEYYRLKANKKKFKHKKNYTYDEPILDRSLFPMMNQDNLTFLSSSQSPNSKIDIIQERENESLNESVAEHDLKKLVRRSEHSSFSYFIPYQQILPQIMKLVQQKKPWKKLKRILKLDRMIVEIYMRQRSNSQISQCYDTISAEDSKTEILFFLLYKFKQVYPNVDLYKNLYLELKFMDEFEAFIQSNIKFIYCPTFLRFFCILELLLSN